MEGGPCIQHCPVMEQMVLRMLLHEQPAVYVDCTLGGGGHARALLCASTVGSVVLAIDRDPACVTAAQKWASPWAEHFHPIHGNFRTLTTLLTTLGYPRVDSILFDLGVSSYQLDTASRGFSFQREGPLDMRMDTTQEMTAASLVNQASVDELRHILHDFGEERWATRIARAIVAERVQAPITTTRHLAALVARAIPRPAWPLDIHPATRVFQGLRIAVNDELQALCDALPQVAQVRPTPQEMQDNPRSRSARLRVAEKLDVEE